MIGFRHVAVAAACALCAAAAAAKEQAAFEMLDGFELAYEQSDGASFVREYVPFGETYEIWSQMQTHQRFAHLAGADPVVFLQDLAQRMQAACPGARPEMTQGSVGAYRNAMLYGFCPHSPMGPEPEYFLILAVAGDEAMHVLQHAWRGDPGQAAFGVRYGEMIAIPLCDATAAPEPCP